MKVIIISVALHGVAGLIAAFITVRNIIIQNTQFKEPPQEIVEEPPPDMKVEIEPEQQQTDQFKQQLKMPKLADIAIDDIDVSADSEDSFTLGSSFGSLRGASGLLGGSIDSSLGLGLADGEIFGLKTKAERFLILIDANRRMLSDDKGGLNSYKVIKDEVANLVSGFSLGTLFNVIFYDQGSVLYFKPKLVPANSDIAKELATWIDPINANASEVGIINHPQAKPIKIRTFKTDSVHVALPHIQWDGNQVGYVTQLALEQNADAIFMITGYHRGFEDLRRPMNAKEKVEWERTTNSSSYRKKLEKHNEEIPDMKKRIKDELGKINTLRAGNGQPPRILKDPTNIYKSSQELGLDWKNPHPGDAPSFVIKIDDIEDYFKRVMEYLYVAPQKPPSVYVVLFLTEDEEFTRAWEYQLKQYIRFFNGKQRIIRGVNELKKASSGT